MESENDKYLDLVSKAFRYTIMAILVLTPWIIFPLTFEFYDSAKAIFLIISTSFLLVLFSIKVILKKKLSIVRSPMELFILFWILINIISTILSVNSTISIWGYYSRFTGGLLLNIFFAVFYFTVVNGIDKKEDYELPVRGFIFSFTILSLFLVVQYINGYVGLLDPIYDMLGDRLGFINSSFFKLNSFNTIGTSSLIPFILLALLPVISNNYFTENSKTSLVSSMISVLSIAITASALGGHLKLIVPILFIFMMGVYTYFYSSKIREVIPKVILLSMIFVIAFGFFNLEIKNNFGIRDYKVNSFLGIDESFNITRDSVESGWKNALVGNGPDTFILSFSQYKSTQFNSSEFWDLRYSKAGSAALELLNNQGIMGMVSFSLIAIWMTAFILRRIILSKIKDTKVDIKLLGFGILPLFLGVSFLFVFFNFFIWFLFWASSAIIVGGFYLLNPKEVKRFEIVFSDENRVDYIIPQLILSISAIVFVLITLLLSRNLYADMKLREGLNDSNKAALAHEIANYEAECELYKRAYDSLDEAYTTAPNKDYMARNFSLVSFNYGIFLYNLNLDESTNAVCPTNKDAFEYFSDAEVALKGGDGVERPGALETGPQNVENHEAAVKIFSSYVGIVPGFNQRYSNDTVSAVANAINLDPRNPNQWLNMGIVLYSAATSEEVTNRELSFDYVELANNYFNRAYNLKPDYLRSILVITQANLLYDRTTEALNFLTISQANFEEGTFEYEKIEQWRNEIIENENLSELPGQQSNQITGDITSREPTLTRPRNTIVISDSVFDEIRSIQNQ